MPTTAHSPIDEFERARADYLAVSRSGHLYASQDEHSRLEAEAWERLERAHAALEDGAEADCQPT